MSQEAYQILELKTTPDVSSAIISGDTSRTWRRLHISIDRGMVESQKEIYCKISREIMLDFENLICFKEIDNLRSFALEVLEDTYSYLEIPEERFQHEWAFRRKNHLYPLDLLLLLSNTETSEKELRKAGTATTLFYMLSHFVDDYLDDQRKVFSKFVKTDLEKPFLIDDILEVFFLAFKEFCESSLPKKSSIILQKLFKYRFHGLVTKNRELNNRRETLRNSGYEFRSLVKWKAYELSGLMYSFLSDVVFLTMNICRSPREYALLNEATRHLGCLCQTTDDLRDFEKDLLRNEINIFCSLIANPEKENGEPDPKFLFYKVFHNEINEILERTEKLNISIDREKIVLISLYPFFMNHL